jgi:hypothetical protein
MTCSRIGRWFHRRSRQTDVEVMWPSLVARADTIEEARVAWDVFLGQRGQEHWHITIE